MITSFPKLLGATVVTLKLLSLSLFFGLFIGLLFAILRLNKNKIINKFAYGYSYVFRGTPLLVQIFIIYFGLGQIEYFRSTFLWVVFKEPYWCAIIAFALIILMMKGTSLASTVTLMDLTGVAKYIISTTFKPIEVFIVAGGIYLFMTFIIHNLIKFLEKKYGYQ